MPEPRVFKHGDKLRPEQSGCLTHSLTGPTAISGIHRVETPGFSPKRFILVIKDMI